MRNPTEIGELGDQRADFNRLYRAGATIQVLGEVIPIHVEMLTEVVLPTGQVLACDPSYGDTIPFVQHIPPGRYPVSIALIRHPQRGNRPLAARLHLAEGEVVEWEMALQEGQDAATLKPGEEFCYGVDAGVGCFMDVSAARLNAELLDHDDGSYWMGLADKLFTSNNGLWMNHVVDAATGANMVVFASGWGDGCYTTFEGWSADSRLLCLLTDFGLHDG